MFNQNKFLQNNFRNQESILLNKILFNNNNNNNNSFNDNEYHTSNNQFTIESGYAECPFHELRTQWY